MISRFNFGCWLISVYSLKRTKNCKLILKINFQVENSSLWNSNPCWRCQKISNCETLKYGRWWTRLKSFKNLPPVNEIQNSKTFFTLSQNGDKITTNWWQEFTSFKKILKPDEKCKTFLGGRFLHFDIAFYFYTFIQTKKYFSTSIFIKKILKTLKLFFYKFYFSTETFLSVQLSRISKPQLDLLIRTCNKVHDTKWFYNNISAWHNPSSFFYR